MKDNKSITVTYHRSMNFGASLQAYALQQVLLNFGNDNKILDFEYSHWKKLFPFKNIRHLLIKMYNNASLLLYYRSFKTRKGKFDLFCQQYLSMTKKYRTIKEIEEDNYNKDVSFMITGSDQVFSLRNTDFFNDLYLLDLDLPCNKFSYAASFAAYDLSPYEQSEFIQKLKWFKEISIREEKGYQLLKGLGFNSVHVHIDPVFLLEKEKWEEIVPARQIDSQYILYYQVNSNSVSNEVLSAIKQKLNIPIVCVQSEHRVTVKADKYIFDAGPLDFLSLLFHSDFIVTTSFHGVAFATLFNKPFYVLTKSNSNPFRIIGLLNKLNLSDRLIDSPEKVDLEKHIDWSSVNNYILESRKCAKDYLHKICFYREEDHE